ncbi:hypothetical protein [Shimia thalassica]|uniref:hypothetical protein n=1 Tax=Shimia thalassica TaxID=1715693 RepID=UPI00273558A2|nr:hypothetical protein [Shimia thalassica]MDP2518726.1 hypothetical protein [Shimia thalassica]
MWERHGTFEVATVRDRTLIATVRCGRTKQTIATATPDAVAFHVPSNQALKTDVEAALAGYRAALEGMAK